MCNVLGSEMTLSGAGPSMVGPRSETMQSNVVAGEKVILTFVRHLAGLCSIVPGLLPTINNNNNLKVGIATTQISSFLVKGFIFCTCI